MARQIQEIITSDLTGKVVPEDQVATLTITFVDARRNKIELDVAEREVADMIKKGREVKRRGRKPGSKNKTKAS